MHSFVHNIIRGGSRTAATSKMEHLVIIVNAIITKRSMLDVAAALDPPPIMDARNFMLFFRIKVSIDLEIQ